MRILLIAALISSVVFESHQIAGQTSSPDSPPSASSDDRQSQLATPPTTEDQVVDNKTKLRFNLPTKTTGGTQIWTDHAYRAGYRIQEHSLTKHFRLLDKNNIRRAWGTEAQCQAALDKMAPAPASTATAPHVAVLLHGLMRSSNSMKPLELALREKELDDVIRFQYASTRKSIDDHAAALRKVLEAQPADAQFSFAGHSMGNIVVRRLVGDLQSSGDPGNILPRCRSMVMLGPPNQGASISRRLAPTGLYGIVTGKGGMELGPKWEEFVSKLATPPFPFAIVAGDVSANLVNNPLVDGDGDFVVSLDEAKLPGSEEFYTLPVLHSFLMNDPRAVQYAVEFITSH
ncbi:esterase/lipase family protein [Planctomycetes bacterium K23_9]|uniref:Alpha/beta hydrolase family protein n=1 Tax=Stieleria marina TaxID=1930275 RepID=A0A517NY97_9BACT|nr:Alpha/beta hydrolase family protein [Planctomycetes bacterium K23_9]